MIVPENFPYPGDPSRDAERVVFEKLKKIFGNEKDFDIYYNVEITHLSNPNVNREDWEIDFIIFNEKMGFLVIEVKGGNPIDYIPSEDKWYSTTRHGNKNEIKNPSRQARQNKYAILEKVEEIYGNKKPYIPAGILVIFPDAGMPSTLLGAAYDRSNFVATDEIENLGKIIINLMIKEKNPKNDPFSGSQVRQFFKEMFAKNIKFELSLKTKLKRQNKQIIEYDKQQLEILDVVEKQDRLIIEGRAGTGKSKLAEEIAKKFSKKFEKVLLICGANKPFGFQLSKIMSDIKNVDVFHFSGLCKELYDKANFTNEEIDQAVKDGTLSSMPIALQKKYETHQSLLLKSIEKTEIRYDALVVDEGQDINKNQWESLIWILNDPEKSPIYIFHDNNQKVYHKSKSDLPDFLPKHPHILKKNYRNTQDIFDTQKSYYKGDSTISTGLKGEPVNYHLVNSRAEAERQVKKLIRKYTINEGIDKKEIAVLTGNNLGTGTSLLGNYFTKDNEGNKKDNLYFLKAEQNDEDEIVFDSIRRYKGLEREIVILFDLEDALNNPEEMYIGLSRPKLILNIIGTEKNIEMLKKISEEN